MRLVVDQLALPISHGVVAFISETGTEHHGPSEGAEAAGNVDGSGAGEVVETKVVQPAAGVPFPVGET